MKLRTIWLTLLLLLLLTSCSQSHIIEKGNGMESSATADEAETIVFWHTYSDEETKVFEQKMIPLFEREHPGIKIEAVRQPYDDQYQFKTVLLARASSNKPPDVVRIDLAWAPEYIQLGLAYPVSGFEDFEEIRKELYPTAMQTNFYDGKYYGLPLNVNTKASLYNKTLMEKAGLQNGPATLPELLDAAERLNMKIGMADLSFWASLPYLYGLGGKIMNDQYTQASGYLDSEETIRAVTRLKQLHQKGVLNPKLLYGDVDLWEDILRGDYLMIDAGPWFFSIKLNSPDKAKVEERIEALPFPVTFGKGSVIGGENLVISKGTKHLDAAWTFARWMVRQDTQKLVYEMGLIPTNQSTLDNIDIGEDQTYLKTYLAGLQDAFYRPLNVKWIDIEDIYKEYMARIFEGEIDVEAGLKEAAGKIDDMLH